MWVKICGNTNLTDAQHAANSGASALGFIFAPSPRRVTAEQVRTISARLPLNVERYGVFGNAAWEEIVTTVAEAGLTGVQLHGNNDPELAQRLRTHFAAQAAPSRLGIVTVLHFRGDRKQQELEQQFDVLSRDPATDAVLIDSHSPRSIGGTGVRYDWEAARQSFFQRAPHLRLIAAGGLDPDNVAEAIQTLAPWGVDVATGVEAAPGRKDRARVSAFIQNARQAFALQRQTSQQHVANN